MLLRCYAFDFCAILILFNLPFVNAMFNAKKKLFKVGQLLFVEERHENWELRKKSNMFSQDK